MEILFILYCLHPVKGTDDIKIIGSDNSVSVKADDVAVNLDENLPLIGREQYITIDTVSMGINFDNKH